MNSHSHQVAPAQGSVAPPVTPVPSAKDLTEGDGGSAIDLRQLLGTAWRGRRIIAVATIIALAFGFLLVAQMQPSYRATATVLFDNPKANLAKVENVLVDPEFGGDTLQNEMQILASTNLIERVVEALNLASSPVFRAGTVEGRTTIGRRLRGWFDWRNWISPETLADLGIIDPPEPIVVDEELRLRRERLTIINALRSNLLLEPIKGSRVIKIGYTSPRPDLSARIVNEVVRQYLQEQLQAKLDATKQASEWLAERVDELRIRVQKAETAVETARSALTEASGQTSEITRQQLVQTNGALAEARAERSKQAAEYALVSNAMTQEDADLGALSAFRESNVIQRLREQSADLLGREAALARFAANSPTRQRLTLEINALRSSVRREAGRIVSALETDLEVSRARERALLEEISRLEAIEQEQRRGEIESRQLEREAQASRTLYETFLARLQETASQDKLQTADARMLSPAEVPLGSVGTARNRVLLAALVIGLALGIGLVFLLERLNNTFRGVQQLETASGLPVLASLPAVGDKLSRADVIGQLRDTPNGKLAEAVRNLRTSIMHSSKARSGLDGSDGSRVLMFTSAIPGEGKSTSSLLTALTSRRLGRSVIIVDCDLRLPALRTMLDESEMKPGLLAVVDGKASVEEAVYHDEETGLDLLLARPHETVRDRNAADVVASAGFSKLVRDLRSRYELVILDTPPALVVSDARIIASLADAAVMAVRWDHTPRGAVLEGLRELRAVDAPLVGVVMTMVDIDKASGYDYEGYGYYGGRYDEYYAPAD